MLQGPVSRASLRNVNVLKETLTSSRHLFGLGLAWLGSSAGDSSRCGSRIKICSCNYIGSGVVSTSGLAASHCIFGIIIGIIVKV